jgi:hypothetical protein
MMVNCMEAVCSILMTINVPVFITAHDCTVITDDDVMYKVLGMTKNHGEKIPWMFDEVWLSMKKKKGTKVIYTVSGVGTASRIAKTRMNLGKDVDHTEIGLPGIFKLIGYEYDFDKAWRVPAETVEVEEPRAGPPPKNVPGLSSVVNSATNLLAK